MHLLDYAKSREDQCKLIEFSDLEIPQIHIINSHHTNLYDPAFFLVKLNDILISSDYFILTKDNVFISDIGYRDREQKNRSRLYEYNLSKESAITIDEPVLVIGGDTNYYHWLINWLPRYFVADHCSFTEKLPIVTNRRSQSQKNAWAGLINKSHKFIELKPNEVYRINQAWVPNFFSNPLHSPFAIRELRRRSGVKQDNTPGSRKIFISRSKAQFRRVVNEEQVENYLATQGFEKIILEEIPFTQQVSLFSEAETIVAPHGAGLANLAFARRNVNIVELFNDFYSRVFWSLGSLIGCSRYDTLKCEPINNGRTFTQQHDIKVDLDKLAVILAASNTMQRPTKQ